MTKIFFMQKRFLLFLLNVVLLLLLEQNLNAQDIHFSQFWASPLSLNPAETGRFDASWRFSNNYRTQWNALGTPFRTISVGFDKPFEVGQSSKIGAGIFAVNDRSGGSKLTVTKILASVSYIVKIDRKHEISVGIQPGYVMKDFTQKGLSFPTQFNPETGLFDPDYNISAIPDNNEKLGYFDMNAGVFYAYNAGKVQPYGGVSLFHLTMPKESFSNNANSKLSIRTAISGGVHWFLTKNWELNPSLFVMYNKKANNWLVSCVANYHLPNKVVFKKLSAGVLARYSLGNVDSFILTAGVNIWDFDLGISYDINISHLIKATSARGAFEVSLIYKFYRIKTNEITIPCDRY